MIYLLDTDTCSFHMRRPGLLAHRFLSFAGRLAISTITTAELYSGALLHPSPVKFLEGIDDLLAEVAILDFTITCSIQVGLIKSILSKQGIQVDMPDLMIASTALVHGLTLVTHNTSDFQSIPA